LPFFIVEAIAFSVALFWHQDCADRIATCGVHPALLQDEET